VQDFDAEFVDVYPGAYVGGIIDYYTFVDDTGSTVAKMILTSPGPGVFQVSVRRADGLGPNISRIAESSEAGVIAQAIQIALYAIGYHLVWDKEE